MGVNLQRGMWCSYLVNSPSKRGRETEKGRIQQKQKIGIQDGLFDILLKA